MVSIYRKRLSLKYFSHHIFFLSIPQLSFSENKEYDLLPGSLPHMKNISSCIAYTYEKYKYSSVEYNFKEFSNVYINFLFPYLNISISIEMEYIYIYQTYIFYVIILL